MDFWNLVYAVYYIFSYSSLLLVISLGAKLGYCRSPINCAPLLLFSFVIYNLVYKYGLFVCAYPSYNELALLLQQRSPKIILNTILFWIVITLLWFISRKMYRNFILYASKASTILTISFFTSFLIVIFYAYHIKFTLSPLHASFHTEISDRFIAHAGGSIDSITYTNSREAIQNSIISGLKFIEVDLVKTSDGVYVGAHDWDHFFLISNVKKIMQTGLDTNVIPSFSEFYNSSIFDKMHPVTASDITKLLQDNEDIWLVTDKAVDYTELIKQIPFPERMIVETFSLEQYSHALATGFHYPALHLHSLDSKILLQMVKYDVRAVTVNFSTFLRQQSLFKWIHSKGISVLVSTVNDLSLVERLYGKYADMFYIDSIFKLN